ncbi:MAG TPA: two-component sensor histidine kinase, partial [Streptosporangiaceae bacterium]
MQRRLLISTLAVAVIAVLLFGLPLAFVLSRLQVDGVRDQLADEAKSVARELQDRRTVGLPLGARAIARSLPGRFVEVIEPGQPPIEVGVRPSSTHHLSASSKTLDFQVTVEASDSYAADKVYGGLLLVGSAALLAVAVAVVLALMQARRLARPLEELARAADRLGSGAARPLGRRYGVLELDRVAEGLDG